MIYSKEKNIIKVAQANDCEKYYALDINTGIIYGIRKAPIKRMPEDMKNAIVRQNTMVGRVLNNCISTTNYSTLARSLMIADKLDALGVVGLDLSWQFPSTLEGIDRNLKQFMVWYKQERADKPSRTLYYHDFQYWLEKIEFEKRYGAIFVGTNEEAKRTFMNFHGTEEEARVFVYYVVRGMVQEYHGNCSRITEYLRMCRKMNKQPQKATSFIREYCETLREYEARKQQHSIEMFRQTYSQKPKAFDFEYGNYKIVVPTEPNDLIDEGRRMHHCVGGYVRNVVDGETYIVFVRRKDTPEDCYITCQVRLNGEIGQYYLSYDRNITRVEDIEFRQAFQTHLYSVWNEG